MIRDNFDRVAGLPKWAILHQKAEFNIISNVRLNQSIALNDYDMNESEAKKIILERVVVTPQKVLFAKSIVLTTCSEISSSDELVAAVLKANNVSIPKNIVIHPQDEHVPAFTDASEAISWSVAAKEAIWSLIHTGYLIPMADSYCSTISIGWTINGTSSNWSFDELTIPVPDKVRRAPSLSGSNDQFLAEPDLYLNMLGISNMHAEVASAFREAVKCFRHELFTAALTMIGKASEGAWLELGASLLTYVPSNQQEMFSKQRAILEDPMMGTYRKIEAVLKVFDRQDIFKSLSTLSGIKPKELRTIAVWSDSVRDSRNTIHFGVSPSTPNTYEKVAALMIGAAPSMKTLYRLKEVADTGHRP